MRNPFSETQKIPIGRFASFAKTFLRSSDSPDFSQFIPPSSFLFLLEDSYLNKQNYLSVKTESRKCRIKERKLWKSKK